MTYDFFADEEDKISILNYLFEESDLQIFDLSSAYGEEVKEYKSIAEISSCFDLKNEKPHGTYFQLWSPKFKSPPLFQRVELNPKHCNGHTFRFTTGGWGLIQLYFGGIKDSTLKHSHIGHFNYKSALKWESINLQYGKVDLWDWQAIQKTSNHLKYLLDKKLAVRKIGTYGVLAGADLLEKRGIILR
ncbi:hypothetical protein [Mucilaginibacter flavidus]|uniref:hypothetical protein n=1 Tax=Mucilaginibacter flavidus TaxID=2949309 RepID=UPI00209392A5|nr:hypothetical protein [Mucilaginibacter flavidus]MCO5945357.1 hypothetical protein [Mucilaginibacter flavidus]